MLSRCRSARVISKKFNRVLSNGKPPVYEVERPIPLGDPQEEEEFVRLLRQFAAVTDTITTSDTLKENCTTSDINENGMNIKTGEYSGPKGKEPTRFGDWELKGRVSDF